MIRVLIVEDTADIAAGVRDHLAQDGCAVRIAASGEEALETFAEWIPDVLLLDLMLPGISGYEVLRADPRPAPRDAGAHPVREKR